MPHNFHMLPFWIQTRQRLRDLLVNALETIANAVLQQLHACKINGKNIKFFDEAYSVPGQPFKLAEQAPLKNGKIPLFLYYKSSQKFLIWASISSKGQIKPFLNFPKITVAFYSDIQREFIAVQNVLEDNGNISRFM